MLRGMEDEITARELYSERFAPVTEIGFITNDRWGFTLGYSPDGLVGQHGQIEVKSRRQKYQIQTLVENVAERSIPIDYMLQLQTGLLVSERQWVDFISFCGGLPMVVIRAYPDEAVQGAIVSAAAAFEHRLAEKLKAYQNVLVSEHPLIPTERKIEEPMYV